MAVSSREPHVVAATRAIQTGEIDELRRLLEQHEGLASVWIDRGGTMLTLLHVVADWPGYFPRGPEIARLLVELGADVNARTGEEGSDTPLHWAASSDDADVAEALIELGADVDVGGGSIGTPLANAVGYGCWHVARLLVANGATVEGMWQAAALGMTARVHEFLGADPPPSRDDINHAFWQACHGGQRRAAEYLLAQGADIDSTPQHSQHTPLDIAGSLDTRRETMIEWLRQQGAHSAAG